MNKLNVSIEIIRSLINIVHAQVYVIYTSMCLMKICVMTQVYIYKSMFSSNIGHIYIYVWCSLGIFIYIHAYSFSTGVPSFFLLLCPLVVLVAIDVPLCKAEFQSWFLLFNSINNVCALEKLLFKQVNKYIWYEFAIY